MEAGCETMTQEDIVEEFLRCALPYLHACDSGRMREIPVLAVRANFMKQKLAHIE